MRFKLLLTLALLCVAFDARAQFTYLDDPALTTGSDTDRVMIAATTVSTTQSSIVFTSGGAKAGTFTLDVTACTACNITFRIETQDADGVWYDYVVAAAAVSGTGKTRHAIGWESTTVPATITTASVRPFPPKFRATVTWNSGTSASYTVSGVLW